ncbi:hypothetical protein [Dyadobacter sp. NIV53]|uniref:hypothetical protein n=1 Tax=Dyadobacter sp. NIV53 TaxID=2861765 RepID=UPI001C87EB7B|nr:hypothetical protein [Dyadobacter sp. NIV53]
MKNLLIILVMIVQVLTVKALPQRLAILPTAGSIALEAAGQSVATLATICIDLNRGAPYGDSYKFIHAGENIPIKVNGSNYPGNLKAALQGPNSILLMTGRGTSKLEIRINPERKDIKTVELNKIDKYTIVGTEIGDDKGIYADEIFNKKIIIYRYQSKSRKFPRLLLERKWKDKKRHS